MSWHTLDSKSVYHNLHERQQEHKWNIHVMIIKNTLASSLSKGLDVVLKTHESESNKLK